MFTSKEHVTFNYTMVDKRNGNRITMQRDHVRPEDDSILFILFMSDVAGFQSEGYHKINYEGSESNYGRVTIKGMKK